MHVAQFSSTMIPPVVLRDVKKREKDNLSLKIHRTLKKSSKQNGKRHTSLALVCSLR